jgi:hypothetical protein
MRAHWEEGLSGLQTEVGRCQSVVRFGSQDACVRLGVWRERLRKAWVSPASHFEAVVPHIGTKIPFRTVPVRRLPVDPCTLIQGTLTVVAPSLSKSTESVVACASARLIGGIVYTHTHTRMHAHCEDARRHVWSDTSGPLHVCLTELGTVRGP